MQIDITRGVSDPVPVAVVPFVHAANDGGIDFAAIIDHDLASSGRFKGLARTAMPAQPQRAADVNATAWRTARADYVVVGRASASGDDIVLHFDLVNALNGQLLLSDEAVTVPQKSPRKAAHRISDRIYEKLTGVRGAFDTRIAYVAVGGHTAQPALPARRGRCRWRERGHRGARQPAVDVTGLVAGRRMAGLCFLREGRRRDQRAARAHRRAAPGFRARGASTARRLFRRMASGWR